MALHKLSLDDYCDTSYSLFAIHCRLEDYRLAYVLNKNLNLKLQRKVYDLDFNYTMSSYAIYEWNNKADYITWNLVTNICKKEEDSLSSSGVLFTESNKVIKTYHLIPEYKQVDYFIKISNETQNVNESLVLNKLQNISQIAASYKVDANTIKSKEHLIF